MQRATVGLALARALTLTLRVCLAAVMRSIAVPRESSLAPHKG